MTTGLFGARLSQIGVPELAGIPKKGGRLFSPRGLYRVRFPTVRVRSPMIPELGVNTGSGPQSNQSG